MDEIQILPDVDGGAYLRIALSDDQLRQLAKYISEGLKDGSKNS